MRVQSLLLVPLLALVVASALGAQAPDLSGTVEIDPQHGRLSATMCLDRLPAGDTIYFLLHPGLNIRSVTDAPGGRHLRLRPAGTLVGDGLLYTVTDTAGPPARICAAYTGGFPVYSGREAAIDYKGRIAFNGRTVRAAEQASWYPVAYEPVTDRVWEEVTYRMRVRCAACTSIYLNGSPPAPGPELEAHSELPRPLLLYAGDFDHRLVDETLIIGGEISDEAARVLAGALTEVRQSFEAFLEIPYRDSVVLMEHEPVERFPADRQWMFVSWPTIAWAGLRLENLALMLTMTDQPPMQWVWANLGHEMAHYYFGTVAKPRGAMRWFFLESTAEYMGLRTVRAFMGEDAFRLRVRLHTDAVRSAAELVSLNAVREPGEIGQVYRYAYGPLLLLGLESQIGGARMGRLLHELITLPPDASLNYAAFADAAHRAGVSPVEWTRFERTCVHPAPAASCIVSLPGAR